MLMLMTLGFGMQTWMVKSGERLIIRVSQQPDNLMQHQAALRVAAPLTEFMIVMRFVLLQCEVQQWHWDKDKQDKLYDWSQAM